MFKMFKKNFHVFILALLLTFSFIEAVPVLADPPVCEEIQVDRRRVLCKRDYDSRKLERDLTSLKKSGHSPLKARGILGELYARDTLETKTKYVSLFTYFQRMGCTIQEELRDGADRGLDDIFVILTKEGRVNRGRKPLFLEAKYSSQCSLKLQQTRTLCQQLSLQWLMSNVRGTQERVVGGARLCFDDKNTLTVRPCSACRGRFEHEMKWIKKMLDAQRFNRAASLLCPDGKLRVYHVIAAE